MCKIIRALFVFIALIFFTSINAQPIIAQFFGIWLNSGQSWQQKFRTDTPLTHCNRLYIAFGKIIEVNGHFSIAFDGSVDHVQQLIARIKSINPTADIFLTVGGNGSASSYGGAANDPEFADNVAQFLSEYGFNGFDVDWENNLDRQNLNQLMTHLHTTFQTYHDKLTLDVWPFPDAAYDMTVLKNNLDQINIMSYGTIISLKECVDNFVRAGFPVNQMIGGIETETNYPGGIDTLGLTGSIAEKANYALQNNMAGMMEWRLDNDYATQDNPNYPTYQGAAELWKTMTTAAVY